MVSEESVNEDERNCKNTGQLRIMMYFNGIKMW